MAQRGRKSAASQTAPKPVPLSTKRPAPPPSLTPEAAAIWQRVVSCFPPSHFRPSEHALLELYCRHVVEASRLSTLAEAVPEDRVKTDFDAYAKLLQARDREARAATALARSLRITIQSRVHKDSAARAAEAADSEHAASALWASH